MDPGKLDANTPQVRQGLSARVSPCFRDSEACCKRQTVRTAGPPPTTHDPPPETGGCPWLRQPASSNIRSKFPNAPRSSSYTQSVSLSTSHSHMYICSQPSIVSPP